MKTHMELFSILSLLHNAWGRNLPEAYDRLVASLGTIPTPVQVTIK